MNSLNAQTLSIKEVHLNELNWDAQFAVPNTDMGTIVASPLSSINTVLQSEPFNGMRFWRIWMDLNDDGDFADVNELVYASGPVLTDQHSVNWTMPPPEMHLYASSTKLHIELASSPSVIPGNDDDHGGAASQRHDHFFVEIDDVISDDGLRTSVINQNSQNGCLQPDASGMIEIPINLKLNIWKVFEGQENIQITNPIDVKLTVRDYTSGQGISTYFFEPGSIPILLPPGFTVASVDDFSRANPHQIKEFGSETYYKFTSVFNQHILKFPAQDPNIYELFFSLTNYPEDETVPPKTHTQRIKIVVGECVCNNIPVSLNMPNPDPVPGAFARAQTYIHAAGNAGSIDIQAGEEQVYFGGTEIILKDGFHAHNGSHFRTLLGECEDYSSVFRKDELINELDFQVFPNPNQGIFQLEYHLKIVPQLDQLNVRIFDTQGRIVLSFSEEAKTKNKIKFNLKDLADGIYWLQLNYGTEQIAKAIHKQ